MTFNEYELGDLITLKRGYDLPNHARHHGDVPVVSSAGISGFHADSKVKGPGVVTGRYGTIGEVHYIIKDFWPLNTTLYVQNFKGNYPRFIAYLLKTLNLASHNAAAAVPGVNRNDLHRLKVFCPPLSIQRRIASILSAYDDLIENNTRRIAILEEMARRIYEEWFVKFKFPGHEKVKIVDSELGKIPEGWKVVAFTDLTDVLSGGTPKTTIEEYWNGDIPFFAPKDAPQTFYVTATEKNITSLGLSKCNSKLYPKDTVFITARGTVGKVIMPSIDMAMNQSCYALRGREGINQLYLFLTTRNSVEYLKKNTGGATFDTIVIDTFRLMRVVKPTRELLEYFKKTISPLFDLILNLIHRSANLRTTRDFLLPKLISGEIDVSQLPEPEEAAA